MSEQARDITKEEALSLLRPFQTHRDPCDHGHVDHTAADHLGERVIHSMSPKGFGADWTEDSVREFIERAERIVLLPYRSHPLAVFSEKRWIRFEADTEAVPA